MTSTVLDALKIWIDGLASNESFRFDPALDEATLRKAEASLGITFPDAYRSFLVGVASGHGNGAFVFALARALADGKLAEPFPFSATDARKARDSGHPLDAPGACGGSFLVWDHGCGEESRLVVTGEERGHVWRMTEAGWIPEVDATSDAHAPLDYAAWLKWWSTVW